MHHELAAAAYHGPPQLTLVRAVTEWTLDPWMLALVVLLGGCYLAGVRTLARRGRPWPWTRTVNFCVVGLGFGVIAAMSALGVYYGYLFYIRAAQTIVLLLLVPLFVVLGRPITLAAEVFPQAGRRIEAVIRSRAARVVTNPAITTLAVTAVPFTMYFTSWYEHGFTSTAVRELTYLALMAPGFVFFWTLLRVDPVPKKYSYKLSMWITIVEVIGDAFLGIAVIASAGIIASAHYHAVAWPWGPGLRVDQMFGGATLWVIGDLVGLPFLAAQFIQFMREDAVEAAQIDAELDARDAARAAARAARPAGVPAAKPDEAALGGAAVAAGSVAPDSEQDAEAGDRPWWETDPRFTSRFRRM